MQLLNIMEEYEYMLICKGLPLNCQIQHPKYGYRRNTRTRTSCLIARHKIIYDFVPAVDIYICQAEVYFLLLITAAAAFYSCFFYDIIECVFI